MNYYHILGVSASATQQEIKRAFRKKALQYHPDRNAGTDSNEQFRLVYIAYDVLQDPLKRSIYDTMQQVKQQCREEEIYYDDAPSSAAERDYARRRRAYEAREQKRKEYYETHYQQNEAFRQNNETEQAAEAETGFSSKIEFHSQQGIGFFFCFMLLCVGFCSLLFGSFFVIWEHFNGAILLGCTFWAVGITIAVVAGKGLMAVFQTWKT